MARRAAPPGSGPAYYNPAALSRGPSVDPNESAFSRFLREQIFSPEKLPGNISIATGLGVFFDEGRGEDGFSRLRPCSSIVL
ncbi:unnamed protein product [Peniophora sp. CBMAI 1063]|nr:unnamed protein product [Peniophora sp. CBMAI 1063]